MKKTGIFFDFDGTLCNTLPDIAAAGNHALAALHVRQLDFRARQPDIRRKHRQPLDGCFAKRLPDLRFPGHHLVHRGGFLLHAHAQAA